MYKCCSPLFARRRKQPAGYRYEPPVVARKHHFSKLFHLYLSEEFWNWNVHPYRRSLEHTK